MNQPDIILLAQLNSRDMLAYCRWEDNRESTTSGAVDELAELIAHYRSEDYCGPFSIGWLPYWMQRIAQWLGVKKIISQYIVRRGFSVSKADKMMSAFMRDQVRALNL